MKRYEGLFILNTAGKEEGLKEMLDKISEEINAAGGKVETVQKMDKRPFARVSERQKTSGFYVNVIFEVKAAALPQLRSRFALNEDVHRVVFTNSPAPKAVAS